MVEEQIILEEIEVDHLVLAVNEIKLTTGIR
jgi:hypothetical protein